ncbi:unnamed protein product [Caenorhabditis sp. 36 PRJEB53466]|nr:unnamed protein product [Caenorhabditis sp. 36 PRJEB53466]
MSFAGSSRNPQIWGSVRQENVKHKDGDAQTCIDVGQIMEKVRRDNYVRHQQALEQSDNIANNIQNWKNSNDQDMKELGKQMELLQRRKEQIRKNSMEMHFLADQLRQKLARMQQTKQMNEAKNGHDEAMQC